MAIAYRASSAPQHLSGAASPHSINLPAGHVANDVLFLWAMTDDTTGTTSTPSGWTKLGEFAAGTTTGFLVYTRLEVFYRIDTGSLGSTVSVSWSAAAWPAGDASVLVWTSAWSGCDTTGPIERWDVSNTTDTAADMAHPQETTTADSTWLITFRAAYSNAARTFTCSVGTDAERTDDNFTNLHGALYDSNAALTAGLQTQRTTTASGTCSGGGTALSIVLKPTAAAGATFANAGFAEGTGTAYDASVSTVSGPWGLCPEDVPAYTFKIDWDNNGSFSGNITADTLADITITYGRDQERQLNPAATGSASFEVINVDRTYSPENSLSPLYGDLNPAREAKFETTWSSTVHPLFRGRIDNYDMRAGRTERRVSFTFLDGMNDLQARKLSTGVYFGERTGTLINTILDLVGWTGGRAIDPGATIVPFWWEEGTTALEAIQKLVKSEGPPSIGYAGPDGTFVFRDRHHRLLSAPSLNVQASFGQGFIQSCDAPAVTGLDFTEPFVYSHGLRDITNSVSFDVSERSPDSEYTDVWTSTGPLSLSIGQTQVIRISASDPFINAITPVSGTDFVLSGAGTVQVSLNRTAGQSADITLLAVGGAVVVTDLKLRAQSIPVRRTVKVSMTDADSITQHGERTYPEDAPWANAEDAQAIANMILLHYATRRPTVQIRVTAQDPTHLTQILDRRISDRIRIRYDEIGLNADFFIEKITHTISRINQTDHPPVHSVVFGCEKDLVFSANPFTFDLRGAGFDEGVFNPPVPDMATTVFIFDNSVNGRFDYGLFGT